MRSMVVYHVDAFTAESYQGNPAGVCVLDAPAREDWMQRVASGMAFSETAFLHRVQDGVWQLRWFTPTAEVKLCGHATLASAHLLWTKKMCPREKPLRFETLSGVLTAEQYSGSIILDFPSKPAVAADPPPGLIEALGISKTLYVGRSTFDYLLQVESADVLRKMKPDFSALKRVPVRGIIVTAPSDLGAFDFISRFFAPAVGVDEDPVTGSAHCTLAPFWAARLGKSAFRALQASHRGGVLDVTLSADRVRLGGQARLIAERLVSGE